MRDNIIVAGGVNPSIFYLIMQAALVLWLFEAVPTSMVSRRLVRAVTVLAVVLIAVSVPFVDTIEPALVIEDPGSVLATFGGCLAFGCLVVTWRDLEHPAHEAPARW